MKPQSNKIKKIAYGIISTFLVNQMAAAGFDPGKDSGAPKDSFSAAYENIYQNSDLKAVDWNRKAFLTDTILHRLYEKDKPYEVDVLRKGMAEAYKTMPSMDNSSWAVNRRTYNEMYKYEKELKTSYDLANRTGYRAGAMVRDGLDSVLDFAESKVKDPAKSRAIKTARWAIKGGGYLLDHSGVEIAAYHEAGNADLQRVNERQKLEVQTIDAVVQLCLSQPKSAACIANAEFLTPILNFDIRNVNDEQLKLLNPSASLHKELGDMKSWVEKLAKGNEKDAEKMIAAKFEKLMAKTNKATKENLEAIAKLGANPEKSGSGSDSKLSDEVVRAIVERGSRDGVQLLSGVSYMLHQPKLGRAINLVGNATLDLHASISIFKEALTGGLTSGIFGGISFANSVFKIVGSFFGMGGGDEALMKAIVQLQKQVQQLSEQVKQLQEFVEDFRRETRAYFQYIDLRIDGLFQSISEGLDILVLRDEKNKMSLEEIQQKLRRQEQAMAKFRTRMELIHDDLFNIELERNNISLNVGRVTEQKMEKAVETALTFSGIVAKSAIFNQTIDSKNITELKSNDYLAEHAFKQKGTTLDFLVRMLKIRDAIKGKNESNASEQVEHIITTPLAPMLTQPHLTHFHSERLSNPETFVVGYKAYQEFQQAHPEFKIPLSSDLIEDLVLHADGIQQGTALIAAEGGKLIMTLLEIYKESLQDLDHSLSSETLSKFLQQKNERFLQIGDHRYVTANLSLNKGIDQKSDYLIENKLGEQSFAALGKVPLCPDSPEKGFDSVPARPGLYEKISELYGNLEAVGGVRLRVCYSITKREPSTRLVNVAPNAENDPEAWKIYQGQEVWITKMVRDPWNGQMKPTTVRSKQKWYTYALEQKLTEQNFMTQLEVIAVKDGRKDITLSVAQSPEVAISHREYQRRIEMDMFGKPWDAYKQPDRFRGNIKKFRKAKYLETKPESFQISVNERLQELGGFSAIDVEKPLNTPQRVVIQPEDNYAKVKAEAQAMLMEHRASFVTYVNQRVELTHIFNTIEGLHKIFDELMRYAFPQSYDTDKVRAYVFGNQGLPGKAEIKASLISDYAKEDLESKNSLPQLDAYIERIDELARTIFVDLEKGNLKAEKDPRVEKIIMELCQMLSRGDPGRFNSNSVCLERVAH